MTKRLPVSGACARQDISEVLIHSRSAQDAEELGATFSGNVQARTRR
jgi:hypothetical protein